MSNASRYPADLSQIKFERAWTVSILIIFCLSCPIIGGCNSKTGQAAKSQNEQRVVVLTAASMRDAIAEVASEFERENSGISIKVSSGPSNALAQQILNGAPADIFVSANNQWAKAIAQERLAIETSSFLTNHLVLIVPKQSQHSIEQLADLNQKGVQRVAIAGESVPAGIYAEQALRSAGVFESLVDSGKIIRASDVRAALVYVERNEVDAAIVYKSDLRASELANLVQQIDSNVHDSIEYPFVLLRNAEDNLAAKEFFDFVQTDMAKVIFARHQFIATERH